jgi:hypothetical protein
MNKDQGKLIFESEKKYLKKWHYAGVVMLSGGLFEIILVTFLLGLEYFGLFIPGFLLILFGTSYINITTLKVFEHGLITPMKLGNISLTRNVKFIEFKYIKQIVILKDNEKTIGIEIEFNKKIFGKKKNIPPKLKTQKIISWIVGEDGLLNLKKILKEKCADIEMSTESIQ